ncbi:unnamed protein product, partial [Ectocarpus fasciculatus]
GGDGGKRYCTVDELLPLERSPDSTVSSEWSEEQGGISTPPYGCDCASSKARYFCPNLGSGGYPRWVPRAVARGDCRSVTREEMSRGAPFPPDSKVLFYGNSYMRQAFEAILCLFQEDVATKKVRFVSANATNTSYLEVPGDTPCRACWVQHGFKDTLLKSGCIGGGGGVDHGGEEACRCDDDRGEFFFSNGAVMHFYFANRDEDKSITDALAPHDKVDFSDYTAVFANPGNNPSIKVDVVLEVAFELQAAGVGVFF